MSMKLIWMIALKKICDTSNSESAKQLYIPLKNKYYLHMKENRFYFSLIVLLLFSYSVVSQEKKFLKYTVLKGETINQIAIKYKVTPYDLHKLNPDAQNGIKANDVLIVPVTSVSEKVVVEAEKPKSTYQKSFNHTVKPKETFYSIARDYNVDVNEIIQSNQSTYRDGLKIGGNIVIPGQNEANSSSADKYVTTTNTKPSSDKTIYHVVAPKETKFGISKQYGISVADLERKNPEIVANLPVGYKLIISGAKTNTDVSYSKVEKPKPVVQELTVEKVVATESVKTTTRSGYANYEVRSGETLYSLSQKLNCSQEELIALNPRLKEGLKLGMILKVPGVGSFKEVKKEDVNFTNLSQKKTSSTRKELVLLIPFNASKTPTDIKKDAFLNMTLDYYSGVLMAIDSAKTLGLNIDVKIFDSQESKMSSDVANIVRVNNLKNADAVIGPFYQQYVEQVAEMLNASKVPVISPLSKETGKTFDNLYQTIPPNHVTKDIVFDYMKGNNANIIAVISPKKVADKEFIMSTYPGIKIVTLNENGDLNPENLKALFVNDKLNYVVVHSEKTAMILSTTTLMLKEMANYKLQMVIIESNDTLDFEEISLKRLAILKMLYPSVFIENNSPEALIFKNAYKSKNKVFPSQYAVRGFDVTFDTMLRLSQEASFEETAKNVKTQQIESKFEYVKEEAAGFVNKGVYILEFQEDYSVKQMN